MLEVVSVAKQYAAPAGMATMGGLTFCALFVGTQFAVPRLVVPFENWIDPVGPWPAAVAFVTTYAVRVTGVPGMMVVRLLPTAMPVGTAFWMVIFSVLLGAPAA
jgi:hypothetical protein